MTAKTDFVCERDRLIDLCRQIGTLDGKPCHISGRLNQFPVVCQNEDWWVQAPYSWPAIAHVLATHGHFKTH